MNGERYTRSRNGGRIHRRGCRVKGQIPWNWADDRAREEIEATMNAARIPFKWCGICWPTP